MIDNNCNGDIDFSDPICRPDTSMVWYVDSHSQGSNDGSSWQNAFTHIQDAMPDTLPGDQVWVAGGTYTPKFDSDLVVLNMMPSVKLYGGFSGGETDLSQRDYTNNETILDGEERVHHAVIGADKALLDGFTVKGGNPNSSEKYEYNYAGGGMYNENVSPLIDNCRFTGPNGDTEEGGGMININSSPTINNSRFIGNVVQTNGGGILNELSNVTINNSIFWGNYADKAGGIANINSHLSITNSTFAHNYSWIGATGIDNDTNSSVDIVNSIFWDSLDNTPEISGLANITYSDIQGGYQGEGNINADPLFVDSANGDLHLQPGSPAVNTGTSLGAPSNDIEGNPRPQGSGSDMGADELTPGCTDSVGDGDAFEAGDRRMVHGT